MEMSTLVERKIVNHHSEGKLEDHYHTLSSYKTILKFFYGLIYR